ncbi:MAG: AMP-binding protein, partial [Deltaproteobacteria bacterium]|nr:AMP-binding protein [Deltaproteobacteria bacterium]
LRNRPEFIEIYLASAMLGAIFVPVNFRLAPPELAYTLRNSGPKIFICGEGEMEAAADLDLGRQQPPVLMAGVDLRSPVPKILDYHSETDSFKGQKPDRWIGPEDPDDPQAIMYTSGTTGEPKGAVLTHRKTFFNCLNADIYFKLHSDDRMLIILPLFHSGGLFIQSSPTLYKGGTIILHPGFDPLKVYRDIERYKVTKFLGVPTMYKVLLDVDPEMRGDLSSLEVCTIGGEKTTTDLLARCRKAHFPLRQIMGQTETSILLWASQDDFIDRPGTVGKPVFHSEVAVFDGDGRRVKAGEIGEIVVRGPTMMQTYWQDPDKTREVIKNGWLHTGDLARMDEEGYFYIVDRARDMYISGGENVYPAEVERALRNHPGVEDVAVIGIPDEKWGETGHAFVIRQSGSNMTGQDLAAFCEGRLARYKWPKKITFCDDFPRTYMGKVRKNALRHLLTEGEIFS